MSFPANILEIAYQVTFESDEELDPEEAARVARMQKKQAEAVKKFEVEEDSGFGIQDLFSGRGG